MSFENEYEEEEEEVVSELEESVEDEDDDEDEVGDKKSPIMGGVKGKTPQQGIDENLKIKREGGVGDENGKRNHIKEKDEKRFESHYPLSPYKGGDGEEEEQEYSTSFYPNDSINQSTISYRSKLSLRSNKIKNKLSKDEDDCDAYSKTLISFC